MAKRIFCNMCGKPFDLFDFQNNFSIDRYAGYGSIYDEEHVQLDLCCECMDDIISNCKISPLESDEEKRLINEYGKECLCEETDVSEDDPAR